jgi:chromosome segregation ATPase
VRTDLEEQAYSELMNLYSKLKDFPSVKQIFEKSSKSVQLYETYTKILEINAEPNLEEKQRMQSELDKALEDNRQKQQTIESLEIKIKEKDQKIKEKDQIIYEEIKGLRNDIRDHDKKQDIYAKESEERDGITHRKLDSISEILTFMNEDISKIKQNGEKTLAGIHDLDQKMDKLSEISDKIYEEAKKASQELIQENLEKFNEKKKELMDRFEIKYSEN